MCKFVGCWCRECRCIVISCRGLGWCYWYYWCGWPKEVDWQWRIIIVIDIVLAAKLLLLLYLYCTCHHWWRWCRQSIHSVRILNVNIPFSFPTTIPNWSCIDDKSNDNAKHHGAPSSPTTGRSMPRWWRVLPLPLLMSSRRRRCSCSCNRRARRRMAINEVVVGW